MEQSGEFKGQFYYGFPNIFNWITNELAKNFENNRDQGGRERGMID